MTKQEIKALVSAKLAGQGNQVDLGNALPTVLDAIVDLIPEQYTLPVASPTVLGGVKVGNGLSIDGQGKLDVNDRFPAWNLPESFIGREDITDEEMEEAGFPTHESSIWRDVADGKIIPSVLFHFQYSDLRLSLCAISYSENSIGAIFGGGVPSYRGMELLYVDYAESVWSVAFEED